MADDVAKVGEAQVVLNEDINALGSTRSGRNTPPIETSIRNLLFISYAYENQVFAKWLARKLAFYGYGVWIDQIQLLGGESWVKDVDIAIKDRSFRVLGLLSKASIAKDNPRKERTLALQLGQQRE